MRNEAAAFFVIVANDQLSVAYCQVEEKLGANRDGLMGFPSPITGSPVMEPREAPSKPRLGASRFL
jgi:hypothetical protein